VCQLRGLLHALLKCVACVPHVASIVASVFMIVGLCGVCVTFAPLSRKRNPVAVQCVIERHYSACSACASIA